eukprot:1388522-Amorphochlora_amoeboformis.AAC.2
MTHYEVLGVEITADTEEIRKAYKKAALRCHPDKNHGLSTKVDQFERVVRAWETLRDEKLREEYNRYRPPWAPPNMRSYLGWETRRIGLT